MPPKRRQSAKDITGFQTGLPLVAVMGGAYGRGLVLSGVSDNFAA